jgi:hypothetical protein
MTIPVRGQLLDHLLGGLDESEQAAISEQLQADPQLRQEYASLRSRLEPLAAARLDFPPPLGLARRTCDFVAAHRESPPKAAPRRRPMTAVLAPPSWPVRVRWLDAIAVAGILAAVAVLVFPAVQNFRFEARRLACQDNLRELGRGMAEYSEFNGGYFPGVPQRGRLSVAGFFGPTLLEQGFVTDRSCFLCPAAGSSRGGSRDVPSFAQLQRAVGKELAALRKRMSGDFAGDCGWSEGGVYQRPKNRHRTMFAIISDAPHPESPYDASSHHGNRGYNVLFEDMHVSFMVVSRLSPHSDDFFRNDGGLIGLGMHPDDAVLVPGGTELAIPVDCRQ